MDEPKAGNDESVLDEKDRNVLGKDEETAEVKKQREREGTMDFLLH